MPLIIKEMDEIIRKLNMIEHTLPDVPHFFYEFCQTLKKRLPFDLTPEKFINAYDDAIKYFEQSRNYHLPPDKTLLLHGMILQLAKALFPGDFYQEIKTIRSEQNQTI